MFRKAIATIFRPSMPTEVVPDDYTDRELERLAADLEAKRKVAIEKMGSKWLFHPDHQVMKKDIGENTLGFKTV